MKNNFILQLFKKSRNLRAPFEGETLEDSAISLELIYDHNLELTHFSDQLTYELKPKWEAFKKKYQIDLSEKGFLIFGKQIPFTRKVIKVYLTSLNTLMVCDEKEFQDIHAFSLAGEALWSIEGCLGYDHLPVYSFGKPIAVKKSAEGRDLLILYNHPVTFATDLLSGKGTYIYSITDDTNEK